MKFNDCFFIFLSIQYFINKQADPGFGKLLLLSFTDAGHIVRAFFRGRKLYRIFSLSFASFRSSLSYGLRHGLVSASVAGLRVRRLVTALQPSSNLLATRRRTVFVLCYHQERVEELVLLWSSQNTVGCLKLLLLRHMLYFKMLTITNLPYAVSSIY